LTRYGSSGGLWATSGSGVAAGKNLGGNQVLIVRQVDKAKPIFDVGKVQREINAQMVW
jgi:hypothetical protein